MKRARFSLKNAAKYPILLALLRKSLIINGAGEGNRTLVSKVV
jgi:hypothetical protein